MSEIEHKKFKIYLVEQVANSGYDTYDSIVVIAENEEEAKLITPYYPEPLLENPLQSRWGRIDTWATLEELDKIKVIYIGIAKEGSEKGVVLASFNAG